MNQVTEKTCYTSLSKVIRAVTNPVLDNYGSVTLLQLNTLISLAEAIELGSSNPLFDTVESAFITHNACEAFASIEDLLEVVGELEENYFIWTTKLQGNPDSEFTYRKKLGLKITIGEEGVIMLASIASSLYDTLPVLDQPAQRESLRICAED